MIKYYELIFHKKDNTYERRILNEFIDYNLFRNLKFIELWQITKINSEREIKSKCLTRIYIGKYSIYLDLFGLITGYKVRQRKDFKNDIVNPTDRVLYSINKKAKQIEVYKVIRQNDIVLNSVQDFIDFLNLIQNKEEINEEVKKLKLTQIKKH